MDAVQAFNWASDPPKWWTNSETDAVTSITGLSWRQKPPGRVKTLRGRLWRDSRSQSLCLYEVSSMALSLPLLGYCLPSRDTYTIRKRHRRRSMKTDSTKQETSRAERETTISLRDGPPSTVSRLRSSDYIPNSAYQHPIWRVNH